MINTSLNADGGGRESSCSGASRSCDCPHTATITADLAVWRERGGISREDFVAAREGRLRGVHYQIINHVLYREHNCMFGPRYTL